MSLEALICECYTRIAETVIFGGFLGFFLFLIQEPTLCPLMPEWVTCYTFVWDGKEKSNAVVPLLDYAL